MTQSEYSGQLEQVECIVVGAGAVGLAVARALAQAGREVVVLESEAAIGTGISSRNSEVIHAGIYYPKDSLMARLCVAGRRQLYAFCDNHGVTARQCGKLIVATSPEEAAQLPAIRARAEGNGVEDLRLLTATEARALEPALQCHGALWSPVTGIVDSHGYMLALQGDAEAAGAWFVFHSPFEGARVVDGGFEVATGGAAPMRLACKVLINSAGLQAPGVAARIDGLAADHVPRLFLAKGNYYSFAGRAPFSRLVYPVPVQGGLGVHLTLDLAGQARFGPDVEWVDAIDYTVDARRADSFYAAVRRYWPGLPDHSLQPAYCGLRPKLSGRGAAQCDFLVQDAGAHGIPGLVNLFGIESPGLTSSLALGDLVAEGLSRA